MSFSHGNQIGSSPKHGGLCSCHPDSVYYQSVTTIFSWWGFSRGRILLSHGGRTYEFHFQVIKTIFYKQTQRENILLLLTRDGKFISLSHYVILILFYRQTDCLRKRPWETGRWCHQYPIEDVKNTSLRSRILHVYKPFV